MAECLGIEQIRLEVTPILDVVGQNVRTPIALSEVNRPVSFDAGTIAKFNNTLAAHVLSLARDDLALSTMLDWAGFGIVTTAHNPFLD